MSTSTPHLIVARNVQAAYVRGLALVRERGVREETRNGPALVVPGPVLTTYEKPLERVLLDPSRDANPFFHLLESFWMLAGRRDVASLEPFNAGLKKYSDDGVNYHGAYGHRWREHFPMMEGMMQPVSTDQLRRCIELLRVNPADRRVVLTMWDPTYDLGQDGADFPCNTQVYFRGRLVPIDETKPQAEWNPLVWRLDMTITCRSNDAIWGAYGANAVHFSVLHEFVAAAAGMALGSMHQLSNNLHAYEDVLERVGTPELWQPLGGAESTGGFHGRYTLYDDRVSEYHRVAARPLFRTDAEADLDDVLHQLDRFWSGEDWDPDGEDGVGLLHLSACRDITLVRDAYLAFRGRDREKARSKVAVIEAPDWRRACSEWLERRYAA